MFISSFNESNSEAVVSLFKQVFSESEGYAEGQIIAHFVTNLIASTQQQDLIGFIAEQNAKMIGCLFFSRFSVPGVQSAFILSPLAVSTDVQRTGVGLNLIQCGLAHLKRLQVNLVFTYGDPSYYTKVGFEQISENIVPAPHPLTQPIGWLAQSLDGQVIPPVKGPTQCVEALNDPALW